MGQARFFPASSDAILSCKLIDYRAAGYWAAKQ
jgi:hypothetical protein